MNRPLRSTHSHCTSPPQRRRLAAALLPALGIAAAVLLLGLAPVSGQEQKPGEAKPAEAKPAAQPAAEAPAGPATYVTSQTCQACHEDIFNAFQKNPHMLVETGKKRGWEGKGCESCHGPGSKHAESASAGDIIQPAKRPPSETDRICLTCHRNEPTHIGRVQSGHGRNLVSCTACHSIHKGPDAMVPRRAAAVNEQCGSCHTAVWSQFQRPYKHRLPEGAMACTDCHNPHGSLLPRSLRTVMGNEPGCMKCHGEKRGPFTFEHAPVKLEGCAACHEPHGSANPRMLIRHEAREVCLECHANLPIPNRQVMGVVPPAFHDLRSPRFRNCTICHQKIHGSHVDRMFLR